jgi:hypothetical protein
MRFQDRINCNQRVHQMVVCWTAHREAVLTNNLLFSRPQSASIFHCPFIQDFDG